MTALDRFEGALRGPDFMWKIPLRSLMPRE